MIERFAHIIEGQVTVGATTTALCGTTWQPTVNPDSALTVCGACFDEFRVRVAGIKALTVAAVRVEVRAETLREAADELEELCQRQYIASVVYADAGEGVLLPVSEWLRLRAAAVSVSPVAGEDAG